MLFNYGLLFSENSPILAKAKSGLVNQRKTADSDLESGGSTFSSKRSQFFFRQNVLTIRTPFHLFSKKYQNYGDVIFIIFSPVSLLFDAGKLKRKGTLERQITLSSFTLFVPEKRLIFLDNYTEENCRRSTTVEN